MIAKEFWLGDKDSNRNGDDHPTKHRKVNGRTIWVTTAEVTVGSAADPAEWRVCEDATKLAYVMPRIQEAILAVKAKGNIKAAQAYGRMHKGDKTRMLGPDYGLAGAKVRPLLHLRLCLCFCICA